MIEHRFSLMFCCAFTIVPSVLNLSSRKKDFENLCSNLSSIFLESTDPLTLGNCLRAIVSLAKGEHSRSGEALVVLKDLAVHLRNRLQDLMEERATLAKKDSAKDDDDEESDDEDVATTADLASSIHQCLRRFNLLTKRWSLGDLLGDDKDKALEAISESVTAYLTEELTARQIIYHRPETQGDASAIEVPKVWETEDEGVHDDVAGSVSEGLQFLLGMAAWRTNDEIQKLDGEEAEADYTDVQNHIVVRLRDRIRNLIILCYEHYLEERETDGITDALEQFASAVQEHALRASGDVRGLFPKIWEKAESPFLRACALTDDGLLIGAGVRYVQSQEDRVRFQFFC